MSIYFEASALWNMYYGETGGETTERALEQYGGYSLEWSLLELGRAIAKRRNLGEITEREAHSLESFIIADLEKLSRQGRLKLVKFTWSLAKEAYNIIGSLNLYASDAAHFTAASKVQAQVMLVDDYHLKRLSGKVARPKLIAVSEPFESIVGALKK